MIGRRQLIVGSATAFLANSMRPLAAAPFEWQTAAPVDAGFAPDIAARLDKLIAGKRAWGLHSVLVARGQRILLERYFEGEDNNWGQQLGSVRFGPDTLHNLYSATKSIVALV
jgi:CubicO group peptidase (beta-lactamase class C family)